MKPIQQGAIYLVDLNPIKGHEQGGMRPVLVLQNDILNKNLNTVIIVPLTKNLSAKGYLTTYYLPKNLSKLKFDSVALIFQMRTIDKVRLKKLITFLPSTEIKAIKEQMTLLF